MLVTPVPQTAKPTFPAACRLVAVVRGHRGWAQAWLGVSLASRRPPLPAVGPPGGAEPPAASVQPAFSWAAETTWPLPGVTAQIHLRQTAGSFAVFTASPPVLPGRAPFLVVDRRSGRLRPQRCVHVAAESHGALDWTCFMRPRGPSVGGRFGDPATLSISWSCGSWGPRPVRRGGNRGTGAPATYLCPSACLHLRPHVKGSPHLRPPLDTARPGRRWPLRKPGIVTVQMVCLKSGCEALVDEAVRGAFLEETTFQAA